MPIQPFISPLKSSPFRINLPFFSSFVSQKNTFGTHCSPFHHLPISHHTKFHFTCFQKAYKGGKNMRSKIIVRIRHSVYKKAVQKITFLLHFLLFFILTVCHPNISIFEEEEKKVNRRNFNVRNMSLLLFHPLFCHKFSIEKRKFLHCH